MSDLKAGLEIEFIFYFCCIFSFSQYFQVFFYFSLKEVIG